MAATYFDLNVVLNILWNKTLFFNVEREQNDLKNNTKLYIFNCINCLTLGKAKTKYDILMGSRVTKTAISWSIFCSQCSLIP